MLLTDFCNRPSTPAPTRPFDSRVGRLLPSVRRAFFTLAVAEIAFRLLDLEWELA
jgi:hypothetical protein